MKTLILLLTTAFVMFAQGSKPIDFTKPLIGLDGKPLPNQDSKIATGMTLSDAAITALEGALDEDKNASGEAKFKLDEIARRIYNNKSATLTVEQIDLIKTRIGKVWGTLVVGAAWRALSDATELPATASK